MKLLYIVYIKVLDKRKLTVKDSVLTFIFVIDNIRPPDVVVTQYHFLLYFTTTVFVFNIVEFFEELGTGEGRFPKRQLIVSTTKYSNENVTV